MSEAWTGVAASAGSALPRAGAGGARTAGCAGTLCLAVLAGIAQAGPARAAGRAEPDPAPTAGSTIAAEGSAASADPEAPAEEGARTSFQAPDRLWTRMRPFVKVVCDDFRGDPEPCPRGGFTFEFGYQHVWDSGFLLGVQLAPVGYFASEKSPFDDGEVIMGVTPVGWGELMIGISLGYSGEWVAAGATLGGGLPPLPLIEVFLRVGHLDGLRAILRVQTMVLWPFPTASLEVVVPVGANLAIDLEAAGGFNPFVPLTCGTLGLRWRALDRPGRDELELIFAAGAGWFWENEIGPMVSLGAEYRF